MSESEDENVDAGNANIFNNIMNNDNLEEDSDNNLNAEIENGHISLHGSDMEAEESSDENEPATSSGVVEFDPDLPTTHKYLGKMNNISGYTLYDHGEEVTTLALFTNTMVFPGFILPLVMSYNETPVMQRYLEKSNVFVLIYGDANKRSIFEYGVSMEIFETHLRNGELNIKARGRQRCMLKPRTEKRPIAGRLQEITFIMLAEPSVTSPICDTQLLNLKAKQLTFSKNYEDIMAYYKYRRYHLSQYPLSSWVYDKNEISFLVKKIREKLANYPSDFVPEDPVQLSYWVAQNYQLNHDERLRILSLNTAFERLRLELYFLNNFDNRLIRCLHCDEIITTPDKVISMSKEGIQSNYVNPGGHVFETLTVSDASNFQLYGHPSKMFSWFPGYAWTIIQCKKCSNHLGWRFTSNTLNPKCFYGLAKSSFKIVVLVEIDEEIDVEEFHCRRSYAKDWQFI